MKPFAPDSEGFFSLNGITKRTNETFNQDENLQHEGGNAIKTPYAIGLMVLFFLAIFLWEFPFSKTIDKEIPAIISIADTPYPYDRSEDSEESMTTYTNKPTLIHVQGKISRKLFRKPEFDTQITVDGFNWTTEGRYSMEGPVLSERKDGLNTGGVIYDYETRYSSSDPFEYVKSAMIFFDDDFEQILLSSTTEIWMGEKEPRELLIIGSAANDEEAEQVLRSVREIYPEWNIRTEL